MKKTDIEDVSDRVIYMYIYMNTSVSNNYKEALKHELFHKENYFLIQGMPVDKAMQFKDFMNNSNLLYEDFLVDNRGYELKNKCSNKELSYYFWVKGGWIYKGSGHLMTKSHLNKNNENNIEYIAIKLIDN